MLTTVRLCPLTTARWTCLPAHAGFCDLVGGGGGGDRGGPGPELHRFGVGARTAGGLEAADQRVVADDRGEGPVGYFDRRAPGRHGRGRHDRERRGPVK